MNSAKDQNMPKSAPKRGILGHHGYGRVNFIFFLLIMIKPVTSYLLSLVPDFGALSGTELALQLKRTHPTGDTIYL